MTLEEALQAMGRGDVFECNWCELSLVNKLVNGVESELPILQDSPQ